MLFWKINNIQRRKILNPIVYIADYFTITSLGLFLTNVFCGMFSLSTF